MSKTIKLNENIYYLLIEKDLDHFTVTTLRNELQAFSNDYDDPVDARRFVYKQIRRLANKKLLVKDHNQSPSLTIYSKAPQFKTSPFIKKVKQRSLTNLHLKSSEIENNNSFEAELNQAKKAHEADIFILESEIDEYRRLMGIHPKNIKEIIGFYENGQAQLLSLQGKLTAINNIKNRLRD